MTKSKLLPGAWTALVFLFIISLFNYMDRFVLAVLLPSIKADLELSDTQLGFITAAFTWSYVLFGIPFARFADRHSRKTLISISLGIWSAMTALCGFAQNFVQLAAARIMIGVGEAGATPPAHSLISDYFPKSIRTKALSIYGIGAPVGLMVGFIIASWLAEEFSWRIAFFALGVPGVIFAVLAYLMIKEPPRGSADSRAVAAEAEETPSFWVCVKTLLSSPAYRHIAFATGLYTVVYIGVLSWLPSYFTRSFGVSGTELGLWMALSLGLSQLIGMLSCGVLTDIMIKRSVRWYAWMPALAMFISTPFFVIVFGTDSAMLAAIALAPAFMIGVFQGPASFAAIQGLAHVRMRAMAVALFLLIVNLVGGTIGPLFTGWLSDQFVASYGTDSLKWSLMLVSILFGLWAGVHYALASRTIEKEINAREGA